MESNTVPAVSSSTLILIRPYHEKYQVYLLKRSAKSGFMPGNYVFPGGKVDADDMDTAFWLNHVDLSRKEIADHLGGAHSLDRMIALSVAAIRETFEEAGVLLSLDKQDQPSVTSPESTPKDLTGDLSNGFRSIVKERGILLSLSRLFRWSHWKTPILLKKRFDTLFFLAVMPDEQHASPDNHEATHGIWIGPMEALKANIDGRIALSPPTLVTLHQLLEYDSYKHLNSEMKQRQWGSTILPRMIPYKKGIVVLEPWDSQYHDRHVSLDQIIFNHNEMSAGDPFSRLWLKDGACVPIGNF